jgi:hypothetical protein
MITVFLLGLYMAARSHFTATPVTAQETLIAAIVIKIIVTVFMTLVLKKPLKKLITKIKDKAEQPDNK